MRTIDMMWWSWVVAVAIVAAVGIGQVVTEAAARQAPAAWQPPGPAGKLLPREPWRQAAFTA
ncbi:MAG: hypothetical protein PHS60_10215 [Zavarzinia sp.]|nr:hypothetical protein [Zavarzinia sp.]